MALEKKRKKEKAIDVSSVKEAISSATNKFTTHAQEDAHEFLGTCLDQIEKEFRVVFSPQKDFKRKDEEESKENEKSASQQEVELKEEKEGKLPKRELAKSRDLNMNPLLLKDPSSRTFAAEVEIGLECCGCGKVTKKSEYYLDFSVDVAEGGNWSTQTLFNRFFEVILFLF